MKYFEVLNSSGTVATVKTGMTFQDKQKNPSYRGICLIKALTNRNPPSKDIEKCLS